MNAGLRLVVYAALVSALCCAVPPPQARAGALDGSSPVICAFTWALSCDSVFGCEPDTIEDLDMPQFFKIDFKNSTMTAIGNVDEGVKKETPIKSVQRLEGSLVLQGVQIRAWSMVIAEKTGKMSLTASGDDEAFVLFGACISP